MSDIQPALIFLPCSDEDPSGQTLRGLLATTPDVITVFTPAGGRIDELRAALTTAQRARLSILESIRGDRPGAVLNSVAQSRPGAELILVTGGVTLEKGWLGRLRAAAWTDDLVAAATTLTSWPDAPGVETVGAGFPPLGSQPGSDGGRSPLHPRVLYPRPPCAWIRRAALELVGGFDESFAQLGAVLADFGARALAHGLSSTLADDLCLRPKGHHLALCSEADEQELYTRHPWLKPPGAKRVMLEPGPLQRSLAAARIARSGVSVTVDARALGPQVGGTQTYVGGLVLALARSAHLSVRALISEDAPAMLRQAFAEAGVTLLTPDQITGGVRRTDVVHRPHQIFSAADLRLLRGVGDRLVLSHMDLISYRTPTYHASIEDWRAYRRTTRLALGVADRTVFFSEHTRGEAVSEELIEPARTAIAGVGVDMPASPQETRRPQRIPPDQAFLLALGADYAHKNRPFTLALFDELRRRHGWDGLLVLAGTHRPYGSSAAAERELLRERPEMAEKIIDLGPVSEPEKRWLSTAARAHICASNYEGFGLIPLEAAAAGRPCIYAPCTSLAEIIDPAAATIIPWEAPASADAASMLLSPGPARDRHLDLVSRSLQRYTWDLVIERLLTCYREAVHSPYPSAAASVWHEAERDELITTLAAARADLQTRVAYGQSLIDRQGGLLTISQQRGLMRVASRRWLRGLLTPFGLLGADQRDDRRDDRRG